MQEDHIKRKSSRKKENYKTPSNKKNYLSSRMKKIFKYKNAIKALLAYYDNRMDNISLANIFNHISYASDRVGSASIEYRTEYQKLVSSVLNIADSKVTVALAFNKLLNVYDKADIKDTVVLEEIRAIVNGLYDSLLNIENQMIEINKIKQSFTSMFDEISSRTNIGNEDKEHKEHKYLVYRLINLNVWRLNNDDLQNLKNICKEISSSYELSRLNYIRLLIKEYFTKVKNTFNAAINFIRTAANWVGSIPNNLYKSVNSIFTTTPKLSDESGQIKPIASEHIETAASRQDDTADIATYDDSQADDSQAQLTNDALIK